MKNMEVRKIKINYNVTGAKRKELVAAIADATGIKAEYIKMPTCSYRIGHFTVTKDGALEFEGCVDAEKIKAVLSAIKSAGFEQEPQEEVMNTKEHPANTSAGLTVEIPLDNVAVENLTNILAAKGTLIKKALSINDLRFEIKDDRIAFSWFLELPDSNESQAYTWFISLLCKHSKELKQASAAEKTTTNEKYAFCCFLLRLSFIGNEYKSDCQILLQNLSGNPSWKNGAPKKETAVCE